MSYSTLKYCLPKDLNVSVKINNLSLINDVFDSTGTKFNEYSVDDRHILKNTDIMSLQTRANLIYDFLETLICDNDYRFSIFHKNISSYIDTLITINFDRITKFNNVISGDVYGVLSIILNNKLYSCMYTHRKINLGNNYLECKQGITNSYVYSLNNLHGHVRGISGLLYNNGIIFPDSDGCITINGLLPNNIYLVNTINDKSEDVTGIITHVTSSENEYITYDNQNKGIISAIPIVLDIFSKYNFAAKTDAYLSNCSADIPSIDAPINQVATTNYVIDNYQNLMGYNNIYFDDNEGWLTKESNDGKVLYYYKSVNAPSCYQLLHTYESTDEFVDINNKWYEKIIPSDEISVSGFNKENNLIQYITIKHNTKFKGKISVLQKITPISFTIDKDNNVVGLFNPSKLSRISFISNYKTYHIQTPLQLEKITVEPDVEKLLFSCFSDQNNIDLVDLSKSNLRYLHTHLLKNTTINTIPSTLLCYREHGGSIKFQNFTFYNKCLYVIHGSYNIINRINDYKIENNHIISTYIFNKNNSKLSATFLYKKKNTETPYLVRQKHPDYYKISGSDILESYNLCNENIYPDEIYFDNDIKNISLQLLNNKLVLSAGYYTPYSINTNYNFIDSVTFYDYSDVINFNPNIPQLPWLCTDTLILNNKKNKLSGITCLPNWLIYNNINLILPLITTSEDQKMKIKLLNNYLIYNTVNNEILGHCDCATSRYVRYIKSKRKI